MTTPFGPFADVMVEDDEGWRTLLAPTDEIAEFVCGTYEFDEVAVAPVEVDAPGRDGVVTGPGRWSVRTPTSRSTCRSPAARCSGRRCGSCRSRPLPHPSAAARSTRSHGSCSPACAPTARPSPAGTRRTARSTCTASSTSAAAGAAAASAC
ncbi:hypothetical protein [Barrientosiimonas endolithica]|uniref:Uncharacterized protein n=1 Tax=Barrientosiimonas endolithica TaxID=1535208 RepID=A0ABM8HEM0_9MICO|nr:hypothetical protein [Barrientosiimonas endolithica]BDZ59360.1 hypothetical protein GCM10025872_30170 [Barrientosiimonas endolithica]